MGCRYLTQLVNGVEGYLNGNSNMIADLKNAHGFTIIIVLTSMVREKIHFYYFIFIFTVYLYLYSF